MSTTIPVTLDNWNSSAESARKERPRFDNPVPAQVDSAGRPVGELDAFLQWEGDSLLARVALPTLPGHVVRARCHVTSECEEGQSDEHPWVRRINVVVEHVDREADATQSPLSKDPDTDHN